MIFQNVLISPLGITYIYIDVNATLYSKYSRFEPSLQLNMSVDFVGVDMLLSALYTRTVQSCMYIYVAFKLSLYMFNKLLIEIQMNKILGLSLYPH